MKVRPSKIALQILFMLAPLWLSASFAPTYSAEPAAASQISVPETVFNFGKVRRGATIKHKFSLTNRGEADFEVLGIDHTDDALLAQMPQVIPKGKTEALALEFPTLQILRGPVEVSLLLQTNDPALPELTFTLKGEVEPLIDIQPFGAVFLKAWRGEIKDQTLRIVNNAAMPLALSTRPFANDRFLYRIDTVKKGQVYTFTVQLKPRAPPGEKMDPVTIETNNPEAPRLTIDVHTWIQNRVALEPEEIQFGTIDTAQLREDPALGDYLNRSIFVRQKDGNDFKADAETDLPFLKIRSIYGDRKDVVELRVEVVKEKLVSGEFKGKITVRTNDPQFQKLEAPVEGLVR